MILNSFALLDAFVCVARLVVACVLAVVAANGLRASQGNAKAPPSPAIENRIYLVLLMAAVLVGLNVVAWPLLYSVLQSYIPYWPGVMCIYGVTRIGTGSDGLSRWLPAILTTLQLTRPAIVFLSGGWLVVYLANRSVPVKGSSFRWLGLVALMSGLTVADAGLELTYLAIPKAERFLQVGCCTTIASPGAAYRGLAPPAASTGRQLSIAYFGLTAAITAALGATLARRRPLRAWITTSLGIVAILLIPVSTAFVWYVAAPAILQLPYHPCAYCLSVAAPESLLGIGSFLLGSYAVGWLAILQSSTAVSGMLAQRLLFLAFFGYLGSLVLFSAELIGA